MIERILARLKGDSLPAEDNWKRTAPCPQCDQETTQMKHGYTIDGKLWKGHKCICKGWQCAQCSALLEAKQICCR